MVNRRRESEALILERVTHMKQIDGGVCAAKGYQAAGVYCGIRKNKSKKDLALIYSEVKAACACVYTQNLVKGAPIVVTKENVAEFYNPDTPF